MITCRQAATGVKGFQARRIVKDRDDLPGTVNVPKNARIIRMLLAKRRILPGIKAIATETKSKTRRETSKWLTRLLTDTGTGIGGAVTSREGIPSESVAELKIPMRQVNVKGGCAGCTRVVRYYEVRATRSLKRED